MGAGRRTFKRMGRVLLGELSVRDYETGALSILILAPKGAGKSTLLATLALRNLELGDLVIWRGRGRDFWPRMMRITPIKVFVHENDELKVWRIKPGTTEAEDITGEIDFIKYSSIQDLYPKLVDCAINVIYEPTYHQPSEELKNLIEKEVEWLEGRFWWFDFFIQLAKRRDGRFASIFIDEIDDIMPGGASGILWKALEGIQHSLAEFREKLVYLFGTTHDTGHVDPRLLKKFDGFFYLRGARAPEKQTMMRHKNAPARLDLGQAIIEIRGRGYGIIEFEKISHDGFLYAIEKTWIGEKVRLRGTTFRDELMEIVETEGLEKALERLKEAKESGEISIPYYYRLKKELEGRGNGEASI